MDGIVSQLDIRRFTPKAQPGDKIGEWVIEDLELI